MVSRLNSSDAYEVTIRYLDGEKECPQTGIVIIDAFRSAPSRGLIKKRGELEYTVSVTIIVGRRLHSLSIYQIAMIFIDGARGSYRGNEKADRNHYV